MNPALPTLRPMTEAGFARMVQDSASAYADDKVRAGQWPAEDAAAQAAATFRQLLPQGLATPGHHLFDILAPGRAEAVGHLWVAEELQHGIRSAYVYDLAVAPAHQRQGHATRAFRALEAWALARQLYRIDLHVFGHNPGAQALYARLGYRVSSVLMAKDLRTAA
jgi:ribosomal protein S18 acetylase RimI-like enzyme